MAGLSCLGLTGFTLPGSKVQAAWGCWGELQESRLFPPQLGLGPTSSPWFLLCVRASHP